MINYLLANKLVEVNAENRWGATALNYGIRYPQIVLSLKQAGGILGK
jgi:hypothetical protein